MYTNDDMYYNSLQYIEIDLVALLNIKNNKVEGDIYITWDSICDVIF